MKQAVATIERSYISCRIRKAFLEKKAAVRSIRGTSELVYLEAVIGGPIWLLGRQLLLSNHIGGELSVRECLLK